jgi:hypothetical protein
LNAASVGSPDGVGVIPEGRIRQRRVKVLGNMHFSIQCTRPGFSLCWLNRNKAGGRLTRLGNDNFLASAKCINQLEKFVFASWMLAISIPLLLMD